MEKRHEGARVSGNRMLMVVVLIVLRLFFMPRR